MNYEINQPPFTLDFRQMSKEDLLRYNSWFHEVIPERLKQLTSAVQSTPGFETWEANMQPESLSLLGKWFLQVASTRQQSPQELREIQANLKFPIDIPAEELTNQTFSLAMDIGMYLGKTLLHALPGSRWDQDLKNKRSSDYGQPVVRGRGSVPLNPVAIAVVLAYGFVGKERPSERLKGLFDIWKEELQA